MLIPEQEIKDKQLKQKQQTIIKQLKFSQNKIVSLIDTMDDYRESLWLELEFLKDRSEKYKNRINKFKDYLKKQFEKFKKKRDFSPSESDKELIKKLDSLVSFHASFIRFYNTQILPIFRTKESFFKFFFTKWDIIKTRSYFKSLINGLGRMIDLNKDTSRIYKLDTQVTDSVRRALEDLEILPKKMIEFDELRRELQREYKEYKKILKQKS